MRALLRSTALPAGILTVVAAAAPCSAEEPELPPEQTQEERLLFRVSLDARYDDNILQLSERDKERLESNRDPNRFLIETPDDQMADGRFDVQWKTRPIPRRETLLRGYLEAYRYQTNSVKDYELFGAGISQELTASRRHLGRLRLEFSRTPHFYLRQLTDDDESFAVQRRIRQSATYAQNEYGMAYDQEIINGRLEATAGWERRDRNYNHHFEERDGDKDTRYLRIRGWPFRPVRIRIGMAYLAGKYDARGDLPSSPIEDDDISYRHHGYEIDAVVPWKAGHRGQVEIVFGREIREFTSSNPFDFFHFDRRDDRRDARLRLVQALTANLDLSVEARRRSDDSKFPPVAASSDEITDFVENQVSLGLSWHHRF